MKNYLYMILLLLIACNKESRPIDDFKKTPLKVSKIDSLNSVQSVETYIHSIDSNYNFLKLKSLTSFARTEKYDNFSIAIAESLKVDKPYYKEDLDNNGFTDLIVIGSTSWNDIIYSFTLLNYGKDSIKIIDTQPRRHTFTIPKIAYLEKQPIVEIYYPEIIDWQKAKFKKIKRLVTIKAGDYVELNYSPAKYNIQKIEFTTGPCYGTCPVFGMIITQDRKAIFRPQYFNFGESEQEEKQIFETTVNTKDYNQIVELLNYIDFPNLQNDYSVSWTDDQDCTLKITYDNGKLKTIRDYGLTGTYGLRNLYNLLFALRKNQNWNNTAGNTR